MEKVRNSITLIGHAASDPEIKIFGNGTSLMGFSLATQEVCRNSNGEKVTETQWHNIVATVPVAESISNTVKKGKEVAITGNLTYRVSHSDDGVIRYRPEIVVNDFAILSGKQNANEPE